MDLTGRRVIVTGGVKGLGRAVVDKLLDKDAVVTVFDVDEPGLEALAAETKVNCVRCDVSRSKQVTEATIRYRETFGPPHALVNNAGVLYSSPLIGIGAGGIKRHGFAEWNRVIASDLSSVFFMSVCIAEQMVATRTKGVIVNVSSVAAAGNVGQSAYSAAKAGVNALTVTWAKELSPFGIRVAGVAPGYSETESTKQAVNETMLREIIGRVPARRLGKPGEIADGIIWVLENDFFNGKILELDGGLRI